MRTPDEPADEAERLETLRSLSILDTPPEERFDRYTRLARRLFGVPIALVSLVDEDRQWFKSRQGLDAAETSRAVSFCGHAILEEVVFVVPNALADDRFDDNPLVVGDPNIRFYAGCPLPGPDGRRLGTLCIIDRVAREFGPDDEQALADIGAMVSNELSALSLATRDELTGVANRRGFGVLARKALAMCDRASEPASLVVFDMDDFKAINDTLGHAAGDAALVEFTRLLDDTFRESDVIARTGGDEFCALLTGTDEADARRAVERLNERAVARNREPDKAYQLGFSAGVCATREPGTASLAALMAVADERMYQSKRDKRAA